MVSRRTPLVAVLVSALGAPGAWGQPGATIDPQKAQAWLEQTFGIKSVRVVDADPNALVTLRTIEARPPSDFRVIVHLENFRPDNPLTPPSSDEEYLLNCPSRRFHVDRIESFSQNGARGAQSTSFGPSAWGRPVPNSSDDRIISALCGPATESLVAPEAPAQADPTPTVTPPVVQDRPAPVRTTTPAQRPPRGPVRVQLFAGDRAAAQRFIEALPARLPAAESVGRPEIVQASLGGRPIYRVQVAGFVSAADAARFCAIAKGAGQDCFVPPQPRP